VRRHLAAALALTQLAACSFSAVRRPPSRPLDPTPEAACDEESHAPGVDGTAALAALATGVVALAVATARPSCHVGDCPGIDAFQGPATAAAVLLLPAGLAFATSSVVGLRRTGACRELRSLQRRCLDGEDAACRALREPPPAPRLPPAAGRPTP
jgi:hypothetical protein